MSVCRECCVLLDLCDKLCQWKAQNSPIPKRAREVRSSVKTMLISISDGDGTVDRKFFSSGTTVNQQFCLNVLKDCARTCEENVQKSGTLGLVLA